MSNLLPQRRSRESQNYNFPESLHIILVPYAPKLLPNQLPFNLANVPLLLATINAFYCISQARFRTLHSGTAETVQQGSDPESTFWGQVIGDFGGGEYGPEYLEMLG